MLGVNNNRHYHHLMANAAVSAAAQRWQRAEDTHVRRRRHKVDRADDRVRRRGAADPPHGGQGEVEETDYDAEVEELRKGLFAAAASNDVVATDTLLGSVRDRALQQFKAMMEEGEEPLQACVQHGGDIKFELAEDVALVEGLEVVLEQRRVDTIGWTPLHVAARAGAVDSAAKLTSAGANCNSLGHGGLAPLHEAARCGHAQVALDLLLRGARVDLRALHDVTPLHIACQHGHALVVAILLDKGAADNSRDAYGDTPRTLVRRHHRRACAAELRGHAARLRCEGARVRVRPEELEQDPPGTAEWEGAEQLYQLGVEQVQGALAELRPPHAASSHAVRAGGGGGSGKAGAAAAAVEELQEKEGEGEGEAAPQPPPPPRQCFEQAERAFLVAAKINRRARARRERKLAAAYNNKRR